MIRRFLEGWLRRWSYRLDEWADRVSPPYRRPPGPETLLEEITRESLQQRLGSITADLMMWPDKRLYEGKIGKTVRVRLPADFKVKL